MKFIKTRITFEKLTERVVNNGQDPCPNCGYSQSTLEQMRIETHANGILNHAVGKVGPTGSNSTKEKHNNE
ncbi:MAG TPA: hypothetical protein PKA82_03005 [Pyrinomonadaceae bacterium]|nr:hypothetical protein [Pyrinomonadaceae bacterium]